MKRCWSSILCLAAGLALGSTILTVLGQPPPVPPEPFRQAPPIAFPPRAGRWLILPIEAVDGDTVRFYWLIESETCRLYGLNAPEMHGPGKAKGEAARAFLHGILPTHPCTARVEGREKYGRALLTILDDQGQSLNQRLIDSGNAVPWGGQGRKPEP